MLLKDYPGYTKAVADAAATEARMRRLPFFPHVAEICGLPVRAFTPRHFLLLDEAASPLLSGRRANREHLAQFLWIVSAEFVIPSPSLPLAAVREMRQTFAARLWDTVVFAEARAGIHEYLDAAFFDVSPKGEPAERAPLTSMAASLIDEFGAEYGWLPEVLDDRGQPIPGRGTLDMPLAWLIQCRRAAALRKNPEAFVGNPLSDSAGRKVIADHVAQKGAKS